jgi:phosphoglycerol transferase MdoB-like AlkP superfamily enzyme
VGNFIDRFKKMAAWQNTLIVMIPDHGVALNLSDEVMTIEKNRIPLILTGGAVAQPAKIDILCNQSDLAATLLGQLGIDHADFPMSRDVLSTTYTYPFAINTWSQGVVWVDSWGASVYDLNTQKVVQRQDMPTAAQVDHIRAYLQAAYQLLK